MTEPYTPLSPTAEDALIKLVETGPVWLALASEVFDRAELMQRGFCTAVAVRGEEGWWAATTRGIGHYKELFPGPEGVATSLAEAVANRTLARLQSRLNARRNWRRST